MTNKNLFITLIPCLLCACGEESESKKNEESFRKQQQPHHVCSQTQKNVISTNQQGNNNTNLNKKNPTDTGEPQNLNNNTNKPNFSNEKKQDKDSPTGLKNLGVSCYLNSTIQQLYNIEAIRDVVLKGNFDDNDKLKALQEMFKGMSSDSTYFDPGRQLLNKLGYKGKQEDASEFLLPLLNVLGEENTEIKDLITFSCHSKISRECKHDTISDSNSNNILLLEINKNNLVDCLDDYFHSEIMAGDSQLFCYNCKKHVNGEKKEQLISVPQTFIIALSRSQFLDYQCSKNNEKVEFPLKLQIRKEWCAENLFENIPSYNLTGVIVHQGTSDSGHYWSYVKKGEKWYKCNDEKVYEVNMDDTLQTLYGDGISKTSAYILFYSKAQ